MTYNMAVSIRKCPFCYHPVHFGISFRQNCYAPAP